MDETTEGRGRNDKSDMWILFPSLLCDQNGLFEVALVSGTRTSRKYLLSFVEGLYISNVNLNAALHSPLLRRILFLHDVFLSFETGPH